ncbi:MAG: Spy/CpxP family protein refolding chaperone [Halomonas sp.]|nr:Spy/CpxP family protein refolding chaperone [Halomonas sp.]MCC5903414.1 Spy/CpxP family protein refolding chaperone [Halomonas sp.]
MNIRKHTLAYGLALALAASGTSAALAQGMMEGMLGGDKGGMGLGMMGEMMGGSQGDMRASMMPCPMMGGARMGMVSMLDDNQRSGMRELMQEHRPAQFERMGKMMNLRDDLMAEMHGDRPAPDKVQTLHGQMAELHGEMMAEMVRMRNAMHDLMSDEQRQQPGQTTSENGVDPDDHDAHH